MSAMVVVAVVVPEVPVTVTVDVPTVGCCAGREREHAGSSSGISAVGNSYSARQSSGCKSYAAW